eukprot:SAG31_NODE_15504_length_750_cov_1.541411_1_plen_154_part_00
MPSVAAPPSSKRLSTKRTVTAKAKSTGAAQNFRVAAHPQQRSQRHNSGAGSSVAKSQQNRKKGPQYSGSQRGGGPSASSQPSANNGRNAASNRLVLSKAAEKARGYFHGSQEFFFRFLCASRSYAFAILLARSLVRRPCEFNAVDEQHKRTLI